MSGRPHSAQTEDCLNPWSCSSAHQQPGHFPDMMNEIFQDLISDGVVCVYLE